MDCKPVAKAGWPPVAGHTPPSGLPCADLLPSGGRWSHAFRSIRCVGGFEIVGPFRDSGIGIALVSPGADAMKLPRRKFLHLASAAAAPAVLRIARAQAYPTRSVRLIAPFPAGGVVDLFSRLIAQPLSERLGQTVIIENRAGAGGNVGTEAAVRASPDGYTLLLMTSTNAINQTLYDKLNFDITRDIIP